ncbi:MAG: T9SS type A sorting domain-containing protein [Flavobacteriaceae bacterium]|nr:T9SS type A sorting domain-containing protein [Bacteroidia bacterium]NNL16894.1 T9SS type A sorting domain-containing protein [Flavobacteriaceae bacterium]
MKTKLLMCVLFCVAIVTQSQNTYVPDDNFEQALIDWGYDSYPLDDYVPTSNIAGVTYLDVQFYGITDLTGIEDFTALQIFICSFNDITSLDLSQNLALSYLECGVNQISTLNVTQNTGLTTLDCQDNQLSSLDLSQNLSLTSLNCSRNSFTSIDVSYNTALESLSCSYMQLTSLDLSLNSSLTFLDCYNNQLTSLDVTQNPLLTNLNCFNNLLTSLDITQNPDLIFLYCYGNSLTSINTSANSVLSQLSCSDNQITGLDLTSNTQLAVLIVQNNSLTGLDIQNGNNGIINTFRTTGNPNLTCINVDNVAYSTSNWTDIDPQHYFDVNCPALDIEESELTSFKVFPNPVKNVLKIQTNEPGSYSVFNLNGQVLLEGEIFVGENELPMSFLPNGMYFLKVRTERRISTNKLIKQ